MLIPRTEYVDTLMSRRKNSMIKIVTGVRRCGKSILLFELFYSRLIEEGFPKERIIRLSLDDEENRRYTDPEKLSAYLNERLTEVGEYIVLLDEIQYVISKEELRDKDRPPRLYGILNSLMHRRNVDVYVTGSNSRLLSADVMTEFRGRGDEIRVFPLSFKEFLDASGLEPNSAFSTYSTFGGLPQLLNEHSDERKIDYLKELFRFTYFRDILERNPVTREDVLSSLTSALCSSVGSVTNLSKLTNSINTITKSNKFTTVSQPTVKSYLDCLCDSFLFSKAERYDVRGKTYFEHLCKFYPVDPGLRNAVLNFRQNEMTRSMETIIYNELVRRGYAVDVGCVVKNRKNADGKSERVNYEIDFVVNKGMYQYYIQSAYLIEDDAKMKSEIYPFSIVGNSFKKIIVRRYQESPYYDEDGIFHVGIIDFLLRDYLSG